jgi:Protein of unknown function (DUF3800)
MKFAYIDESGERDQGDVFTMAGILVDATKLRKWTAEFDTNLLEFKRQHPAIPDDFKTKAFINGRGGWRQIDAEDRKQFLRDICAWVVQCGQVYAYGMSFQAFENAVAASADLPENQNSYWVACSLFTTCMIQKKNQKQPNNKGLTVLIFDDNKVHMPKLLDGIYKPDGWFDGIYAQKRIVRGKSVWGVKPANRFDHIINSAFAIKSEHSPLVQVADILSYIYRRHLELFNVAEAYVGEQVYYQELVAVLEPKRQKLGQCPNEPAVAFYKAAKHANWGI